MKITINIEQKVKDLELLKRNIRKHTRELREFQKVHKRMTGKNLHVF